MAFQGWHRRSEAEAEASARRKSMKQKKKACDAASAAVSIIRQFRPLHWTYFNKEPHGAHAHLSHCLCNLLGLGAATSPAPLPRRACGGPAVSGPDWRRCR
eukprot:scaffold7380_cov240-Pinguiococcus_pyrenoidosus.AAC.6